MRKVCLFMLLILNGIPVFSQNKIQIFLPETKERGLVKRTVAILPIHNASLNPEFDYLSATVADGLRAALADTNTFILLEPSVVSKKISELKIDVTQFIWEEEAINLSIALGCDVVVFGFLQIDSGSEEISMSFNALDARLRKSAVRKTSRGPVGVEIFKTIKTGSAEMAQQMVRALKPFKEVVRLSPQTNAAISLASAGTFLLLSSIPLLAVDQLYVVPLLNQYQPNSTSFTYENYQKYVDYYNANLALLYSGFTSIGLGSLLLIGSIPLFYFGLKKDVKKVTYVKPINDGFEFGVSIRF